MTGKEDRGARPMRSQILNGRRERAGNDHRDSALSEQISQLFTNQVQHLNSTEKGDLESRTAVPATVAQIGRPSIQWRSVGT